jgi:hypothetical protein
MKTKNMWMLVVATVILASCKPKPVDEKVQVRLDSLQAEKMIGSLSMAEEYAKVRKETPKNLTADSVARTLFYVLDSVEIPFSEASIELSTVHTSNVSGGASFIIGYEYGTEKERSGTVTYNFSAQEKKLTPISLFAKAESASEAAVSRGIFKKRRHKALGKVNLASSLITAIKDAVDSKTKINNLGNEKYKLKDFEIELSFVVTNTHDGKLEFKLWDLIEVGGGGSLENAIGHKITIKFDN